MNNLLMKAKAWLTRERLVRLGWYGALAALLVVLGTASYTYRTGRERAGEAEAREPVAVMAAGTPKPMEALFVLPTPTPAPTPAPVAFSWPVAGEIIGEYAPEALIWSETLNQWQNHPGVDIAAAAGEAVTACADGTVQEAWADPLWGNVIEIAHDQGYVSTYANLNTLNMVAVGDAVAAGEIIAAVGDTADCESALPWHLHFALTRDGKPVDPQKLCD